MKKIAAWLNKIIRISCKKFIKLLKMLLNWRFFICFGIAWLITNGWSYLFVLLGDAFSIKWMKAVGASYLALIWLPITPEKFITVAIAIFLQRIFFPHDKKTSELINSLMEKEDKTEPKQEEIPEISQQ